MRMQCVYCRTVAGSKGQKLRCFGSTSVHMEIQSPSGQPPCRAEHRTDGLQ